jgi:acetate kinase
MRVLVVNAGSSSIKLSVLGDDDAVESSCTVDGYDGDPDDSRVAEFLGGVGAIDSVGHRGVHGGVLFRGPVAIDDDVRHQLGELVDLAPLHQPRSLAGIDALRTRLPDVVQVACFDTAFHMTMPAAASTYALPAEWRERWPIRRYGFHGLSHAYASRRAAELVGAQRVVVCHLGAGASLCAVRDGQSIDTTMGFTPLEGLVMATRSGSIDPGLVTWLVRDSGLSIDAVDDALSHRSGLLGLAGTSDMREVVARRARGDENAKLAFAVYVHRLVQEIAAMVASLGGLDALVLTGGVGEHAAEVRAAACERLAFLGVVVDPSLNDSVDGDAEISSSDATVRVLVVRAREDLEIARQVRTVVS